MGRGALGPRLVKVLVAALLQPGHAGQGPGHEDKAIFKKDSSGLLSVQAPGGFGVMQAGCHPRERRGDPSCIPWGPKAALGPCWALCKGKIK